MHIRVKAHGGLIHEEALHRVKKTPAGLFDTPIERVGHQPQLLFPDRSVSALIFSSASLA
jgi:hypothetical protein